MNAHVDLPAAREVCPTTTRRLLAEGALQVDVRERPEVARRAFDVPALVQMPLSELAIDSPRLHIDSFGIGFT